MNINNMAREIVNLVGGIKNISDITHCATRLRLVLKDNEKADIKKLDQLEGVLKAQYKGGQMQIVIGGKVGKVYAAVIKTEGLNRMDSSTGNKKIKEKNPLTTVIETIAGIFVPLLPPLVGCGMITAFVVIVTNLGWVDPSSGFVEILRMIGNLIFYFMPFFLAVSAARKFNTNEFLAIALAGAYMHPAILDDAKAISTTGIDMISFLGLPILLVQYSSSVIPIILSVWILSYVYRFVDRVIPEFLQVLLTPMIVLFIMVPLQLIVLGPIGSYIGNWLVDGIDFLFATTGIFAGAILGFFRPILVMFGMHYSIMPMQIQQLSATGASVLLPSALAANLAQAGSAFAVFYLTKDKTMKSAAGSSAITAAFGITEPAIYGVNLKYKRPFFAACASAGLVSGFFSLVNARGTALALPGILALPTYEANNFIFMVIGLVMAVVLAFVFTVVIGIKEDNISNQVIGINKGNGKQLVIKSPLKGIVKDLLEVDDKTFSQNIVGKGVAIVPEEGKVYAPFDGEVLSLFNTKHAIGLKSNDGVEVLIHIGIDTVNLAGKHFVTKVEKNQKINKGDLLIEFDINEIQKEGYDTITPIVITNSGDYLDVIRVSGDNITYNEDLLKIFA
ncbi:PTS beta-glucoside transporter subunit EIIBCA [Alkalibaculum sp. M08DMB]|uniref:PTS beta-glucoside transporter subunit EIIBCA n=1 Tax=Alkalibaculum sporogenes TaxID=2655001 RepID=A0A6A7KCN9_9FIRM|nr:beta-glucoside-specific PTS transporter subunit IIABC [Alkalibaculum sporogenes]MPW27288.1 PTS beta-glucoside transporter subunit EIIBCA [Alkalibaculum sporogenes]